MSYILDALKKAEAERDPDARASLAIEARERRKQRLLVYAVTAALIANATLVAWILLPAGNDSPAPSGVAATPAQTLPRETAREANVPAAAAATVSTNNRTSASAPDPVSSPGSSTPQASTSEPEPARNTAPSLPTERMEAKLADLPESVRRNFPTLEFSTHIYADDPSLRAIVVNGVRLTEGDPLEGAVVHEITEDGAIFEYERYLVEVPVLDDWN